MSKLDELCQAHVEAQNRWREYRSACFQFSQALFSHLKEYLDATKGAVRLVPASPSDYDLATLYSAAGATEMTDDGDWRVGFLIQCPECSNSRLSLRVSLRFQQRNGDFEVRLLEESQGSIIDPSKSSDFVDFWDSVFESLLEHFEKNIDFLREEQTTNVVGF
jgi:hypothetical protein